MVLTKLFNKDELRELDANVKISFYAQKLKGAMKAVSLSIKMSSMGLGGSMGGAGGLAGLVKNKEKAAKGEVNDVEAFNTEAEG